MLTPLPDPPDFAAAASSFPFVHLSPLPLNLLTTLTPSSPSRAWFTAPHPTLPLLATCHADKSVRIYSLTTHTLLSTISGGHKRSVRCCAWKPNLKGESVLATGSFDATVGIWRCWDAGVSGMKEAGTAIAGGQEDNGEGGGEGEEEDDDEEWRFALVLEGHESEVKSVGYSSGGNLLASCSRDKSVWIWEEVGEDDYETVAVLQEHEGDVKCVAWHPEEELLASGSYDDEIRLWREEIDDWGCVGVLRGHGGTVWCVAWEGGKAVVGGDGERHGEEGEAMKKEWLERREKSGPRLMSCSADMTVRVWRRVPRERVEQSRLSIIRSGSNEEEWVEEAVLPKVHTQSIYAVAWSTSGKVVSSGGDGTVVVYEERWDARGEGTEWVIIAQADAAHGVFEVNHVSWAGKRTARKGGTGEGTVDGGCIVSTGDDGCVKIWELKA